MFLKEDVTPLYVDKLLYTWRPPSSSIPALTTFAVIPFGSPLIPVGGVANVKLVIADVNIGILYIFALTSLGVYGIVLAGWSSNNKYSLLGGLRSSAQIISYELSMGLAAIATFVTAGSLKPSAVVDWQVRNVWNCVPQFVGFVDLRRRRLRRDEPRSRSTSPEAEAELVAGYHTEYSAFKFGMFFMSEYANMIAASAMIVTLYLGGWSLPFVALTGVWGGLVSIAVFCAKTLAVHLRLHLGPLDAPPLPLRPADEPRAGRSSSRSPSSTCSRSPGSSRHEGAP